MNTWANELFRSCPGRRNILQVSTVVQTYGVYMIKKALIFATVAATLTSGTAFAQSHDGRYERNDRHEQFDRDGSRNYSAQRGDYDRRDGRYAESHRYDRHDGRYAESHRYDRHDGRRHYGHHDVRRDDHRYGYGYGSPYRGRDRYVSVYSAGPRHEFHRGGYLPRHYRGSRYVVHDYRGRYLGAPHRGHQWVQVGNDYLLVALATGLITQVLINN